MDTPTWHPEHSSLRKVGMALLVRGGLREDMSGSACGDDLYICGARFVFCIFSSILRCLVFLLPSMVKVARSTFASADKKKKYRRAAS